MDIITGDICIGTDVGYKVLYKNCVKWQARSLTKNSSRPFIALDHKDLRNTATFTIRNFLAVLKHSMTRQVLEHLHAQYLPTLQFKPRDITLGCIHNLKKKKTKVLITVLLYYITFVKEGTSVLTLYLDSLIKNI